MKEFVKSHLNQIGIDSVKEFTKRVLQATLDKIIEFNKKQPNVIRKLPKLEDSKAESSM